MELLIAFLAFGTMGAAAVFGYLSAQKTQDRLHSSSPASTLAADSPDSRANNADKMGDV